MRILSAKEQDRMISNGWKLRIKGKLISDSEFETALKATYKQVKLYRVTTSVKGYYSVIAMVKF